MRLPQVAPILSALPLIYGRRSSNGRSAPTDTDSSSPPAPPPEPPVVYHNIVVTYNDLENYCHVDNANNTEPFVFDDQIFFDCTDRCCKYNDVCNRDRKIQCKGDRRQRAAGDGGVFKQNAMRITDKWVVVYDYHSSIPSSRTLFYNEMPRQAELLGKQTCNKWIRADGWYANTKHKASFQDGNSGCNAPLGRYDEEDKYYPINIAVNCEDSITHEILHALGIKHEHQRPDRGTTERFDWRLFSSDFDLTNYAKQTIKEENFKTEGYEMDMASRMHYYTVTDKTQQLKISDRFGYLAARENRGGSWYDDQPYDKDYYTGYPSSALSYIDAMHLKKFYDCNRIQIPRNTYMFMSTVNDSKRKYVMINDNDQIYFDHTTGTMSLSLNYQQIQLIWNDGENGDWFNLREGDGVMTRRIYTADGSTVNSNSDTPWARNDAKFKIGMSWLNSVGVDPNNLGDLSDSNFVAANTVAQAPADAWYFRGEFLSGGKSYLPPNAMCQVMNGYCSDFCESFTGYRVCSCPDGWEIDPSDSTKTQCIEINECVKNASTACGGPVETSGQRCLNMYGKDIEPEGFRCRCDYGFEWNDDSGKCLKSVDIEEFKIKDIYGRCFGWQSGLNFRFSFGSCDASNNADVVQYTADGELSFTGDSGRRCMGVHGSCVSDKNYHLQAYSCAYGADGDQKWELRDIGINQFEIHSDGCDHIQDKCVHVGGDGFAAWWNTDWNQCTVFTKEVLPSRSDVNPTENHSTGSTVTTTDISGEQFCVKDWERVYQGKTQDTLLCINHVTGSVLTWNFKTGSKSTYTDTDCIYDPLDIQMLIGNDFIVCVQKENKDSPWNDFCHVGDNSYAYIGKLTVADVNNDGFDEVICMSTDKSIRTAKIVNGNWDYDYTEMGSLAISTGDQYEFLVMDVSDDGLPDAVAYHSATQRLQAVTQMNKLVNYIYTYNGKTYCPSMDGAYDIDEGWICDWWVSSGHCESFGPSKCKRSCGFCMGTATCGNNFVGNTVDCHDVVLDLSLCSEAAYATECSMACTGCVPNDYPTINTPWWSPILSFDTDSDTPGFCTGLQNYHFVGRINTGTGINSLYHLCFNYQTGTLTNWKGTFFTGFCTSNYQKKKFVSPGHWNAEIEELDMPDQRNTRFFLFNDADSGKTEYMCVDRLNGKLYYTGQVTDNIAEPITSKVCENNNCDINATCSDNNGVAACTCNSGYTGDGTTCTLDDPCAGINCGAGGSCVNGVCNCNSGYALKGSGTSQTCYEVDPCSGINCGSGGSCVNGVCNCNSGYALKGSGTSQTCYEVDPCAGIYCGGSAAGSCKDGVCACMTGYQLKGSGTSQTCEVDPCYNKDCGGSAAGSCKDGVCACNSGYELKGSGSSATCQIISTECPEENNPCDTHKCDNGQCAVLNNNAVCVCNSGFKNDNYGKCVAVVDPCASHTCDNGRCVNDNNSAYCICNNGFENVNGVCQAVQAPVNPCDNHVCNNGRCVIDNHAAYCVCENGFEKDVSGACVPVQAEVDPCDTHTCDNGKCVLDDDAAYCACNSGYENNNGACVEIVDVDPCDNHSCPHGRCVIDNGSAHCICNDGFAKNQSGVCEAVAAPVNPCDNHSCANGKCVLDNNQAYCACNSGYDNVNGVCQAIAAPVDPCAGVSCDNGRCGVFNGNAECICNDDYEMDMYNTCVSGSGGPVNPCDNTVCNNGRCVVHNGNAECVCNNGYELQNNACVTNPCDSASCPSGCFVDGSQSAVCACPEGEYYDGSNCQTPTMFLKLTASFISNGSVCDSSSCSHGCQDVNGSAVCHCPNGKRLSNDGLNCENIPVDPANPCESKGCSHGCGTVNGGAVCYCPADGKYILNAGTTCELVPDDNQPCANSSCDHCFINTNGDSECGCPTGQSLDSDGVTCVAIADHADCQPAEEEETPVNNNSGPDCSGCSHGCYIDSVTALTLCSCPPDGQDWIVENGQCVIDATGCDSAGCSHACYIANGKAKCACPVGWEFENGSDTDCIIPAWTPCFENKCSHACLEEGDEAICACPADLILATDGLTCLASTDVLSQQDAFSVSETTFIRSVGTYDFWMPADRSLCVEMVPKLDSRWVFGVGNSLELRECNDKEEYQRWAFDATAGTIKLIGEDSYCVTRKGHLRRGSYINASRLYMAACDGNIYQKWKWDSATGTIILDAENSEVIVGYDSTRNIMVGFSVLASHYEQNFGEKDLTAVNVVRP